MAIKLLGSVGLSPGSDSGFDLDTKGQLHGYTTTQYALDVGTNNFVIYADSTTSSGLAYGASPKSVLSATGDILYASGANTLAKLAKASDGDTLQLASGVPAWVTVAGGGGTAFFSFGAWTDFFGTNSSFWGALSGAGEYPVWSYTESLHTIPVNTDLTFTRFQINILANGKGSNQVTAFRDDGADVGAITITASNTGTFDSGAVSVNIASGSLIDWAYHGTVSGSVVFYTSLGTVTTS